MRRRPLRGKKFAPRMTEEELTNRVAESFQELGGANFVQAKILYELKLFLMKRPNEKLACMTGHVKERKAKAWVYAYTLVIEFMKQYKMKTAMQVFDLEKERKKIPTDNKFLQETTPSRYMMGLIKAAKRKKRFRTRVEEHMKMLEKARASPPRVSLNFDFEVVKAGTRKKLQSEMEPESRERVSLTESFADDEITVQTKSSMEFDDDSFVSE